MNLNVNTGDNGRPKELNWIWSKEADKYIGELYDSSTEEGKDVSRDSNNIKELPRESKQEV